MNNFFRIILLVDYFPSANFGLKLRFLLKGLLYCTVGVATKFGVEWGTLSEGRLLFLNLRSNLLFKNCFLSFKKVREALCCEVCGGAFKILSVLFTYWWTGPAHGSHFFDWPISPTPRNFSIFQYFVNVPFFKDTVNFKITEKFTENPFPHFSVILKFNCIFKK